MELESVLFFESPDELEPVDDESDFESLLVSDFELSPLLFDEPDEPLLDERLSVLKKPEPLKVTPTGWNTFLTGMVSPVSGCAYSVNVGSLKACWTSIVSPESTNL
ncbi:MAG: hypothetical protein AAFY28_13410 [Actinomycetota bacterium]